MGDMISYFFPSFLAMLGCATSGYWPPEEPKPGISPGPGHILKVIGQMKTEQISVILMEMFYDEKPARLVAGKAGGRVVKVANSVGGSEEARNYFSMIDAIVRHLAEALQDH